MRIMRKDYDKPHRCPGWSGPGYKYRGEELCPGGSLDGIYDAKFWALRIHRHKVCGTITLPHALRWLQPSTYVYRFRIWKSNRGLL